jgi:hypothetical protein
MGPLQVSHTVSHPVRPYVTRIVGLLLAIAVLVSAREVSAAEDQELEAVKARLDAQQYDEAIARLARMLDAATPACSNEPVLSPAGCRVTNKRIIERARGYYTIALLQRDRRDDAAKQVWEILVDNPQFQPSPADFPVNVVDLIIQVKQSRADELARIAAQKAAMERAQREKAAKEAREEREYIEAIEMLARTETVVDTNSRWIAMIPFGVGQFQNDNAVLGGVFMGFELALAGTAIGTSVAHQLMWANGVERQTLEAEGGATGQDELDEAQLNSDLLTLGIVNQVSMGLLAATMIAGIIEAQVNFEPEVTSTRTRPIRKRPPSLDPKINVTGVPDAPEAMGLGVTVTF